MSKEYKDLMKRIRASNGISDENEKAADAVLNILRQGSFRADNVLASMFERISCPTQIMEWMFDRYWGNYVRKYAYPSLERIYQRLKKTHRDKDNPLEYNDGDNSLWIIPDPKKENRRILVHTEQSINALFIWTKYSSYTSMHVRLFYNVPNFQEDKYTIQEEEDFKQSVAKHGIVWAIRQHDRYNHYSDDILGNPYPDRPSFSFFENKQFVINFGDHRDKGYVLSYDSHTNTVGSSVYHHSMIKILLDISVGCMLNALFREGPYEKLKGYCVAKKKRDQARSEKNR